MDNYPCYPFLSGALDNTMCIPQYELPYLNLHCSQIQLFSFLGPAVQSIVRLRGQLVKCFTTL